jgi:hypothetical protein
MPWVEVFAVLVVSHAVGDFLLQTEWQATRKRDRSVPAPERRRALAAHVATYTLAFVPALVWLAGENGAAGALAVGAAIAVAHALQDDGRLLAAYIRTVKHTEPRAGETLFTMVDQTLHLVVLFGLALLAGR